MKVGPSEGKEYVLYADALAGNPGMVCYAVKANSNLGVLNLLARLGAGFDIVSSGELERVLAAGGDASRIVFSGVGKSRDDMRRALEAGVHCFNVESDNELERLQNVAAAMEMKAPVSLRVNPDVDAGTHPYIATGLKDELPAVPGVAERFGQDVLHCPYCHGWEVRDRPFGVLATSPLSVHQALMVSQWSKDVTLFLHEVPESDLSDDDLRRLAAAGVSVVPGEVARLVVEADRLTGVRLADGTTHARSVLFTAPRPLPQTTLLEKLGAQLDETPFGAYPVTDPTGRTTVPEVWAAGNAMGFSEQVINAASSGYRAGATINGDLLMTDLDAATRA